MRKILTPITTTFLLGVSPAFSQDTIPTADTTKTAKSKFTISALVDVYYRYNLSNPKKEYETFNNYTSFTNSQNSFELNMASVRVEHTTGKVGMVADIGFGKRPEEFSYNDTKSEIIIKQAYLTYAPWEHFKFTAGSWSTHIGYELLDAYLNRNYSMSYMFSYGPFFNTGIKAEATFGKHGFMLGITDPSDLKSADFSHKSVIAQYSFTSEGEKLKGYLNYQGGHSFSDSSRAYQLDLVLLGTITPKFSIGYNGTYQFSALRDNVNGKFGDNKKWWGSALYFNVDPKPWLGLTLRTEYFDDKEGASAGDFETDIFETTLSANFKINNLTIVPEIRYENAGKGIYVNHEGESIKSTATFLVGAYYHF